MIDRVKRVSSSGDVDIDPISQKNEQLPVRGLIKDKTSAQEGELIKLNKDNNSVADPVSSARILLGKLEDPMIIEVENEIEDDLKEYSLYESLEAIPVLTRYLARSKVNLLMSDIYNVIFGSQIRLLRKMNMNGFLSEEECSKVYDEARIKYPNLYSKYSFQEWVNYLKSMLLIRFSEEEKGYNITVRGQSFLHYLVNNRLSDNKLW